MNTDTLTLTDTPTQPHATDTAAAIYIAHHAKNGLADLVNYVIEQEKTVCGGMGDYFMKRDSYLKLQTNDMGERVTDEADNIFRLSNETLGAIRSQIVFKAARTKGDLFGSTPWFAAVPEGRADNALAEKIYAHLHWKLKLADAQHVMEQMITQAYHMGEAIGRIGWRRDVDRFERKTVVAVRKDGKKTVPLTTPAGDYLTQDSASLAVGADGQPLGELIEGEPEPESTLVFADAPTVPYPTVDNGVTWDTFMVDEEEVAYDGLQLLAVDYTAFRCALGYPSIAEAPLRGHVYELLRTDLYERLLDIYGVEDEWPQPIHDLWAKTATDTTDPKTPERARQAAGSGDPANPIIRMFDAEVKWACAGDGKARWYFVTVMLDHQDCAPVFVEYLRNVLPTGHRLHRSLYTVSAIDPLPGHWEGRGEWEKYGDVNNLIDRLWNNMLHGDSMSSNPMTAVDWSAIEEAPEDVQFRAGAKVTLQRDRKWNDFMGFIEMPETKFQTSANLQFVMNTNMLETGVTSAAKGGVGDLPATNTATGIQSVLASGSTLHQSPSNDLRKGFEVMLTNAAAVLYSRQDTAETFAYGEGGNEELVNITPADVRDLTMNITLLMTRAKNSEIVERARTAIGVHTQYLALPEPEKGPARPLYVELLKGLEIQGANEIIREPMEQDPNAAPAPSPLENVRVDFAMLPAKAQAQMLAMMGFEDITPEDMQAEKEAGEEGDAANHSTLNSQLSTNQ